MSEHTFDSYPFPKHLAADVKSGRYRITSKDGTSEVVDGDNARDAINHATIKNIEKVEYLGFFNKNILASEEVILESANLQEQSDSTAKE